ncbi:peptidylprolyl isomerase [Paragemmobacter straminiformis]|uniref:Parvulin-like PPIase n=1 Tax=Paragemmobacter straminiformis TaxID=2045119 RepID=A0A842I9D1_9RHOB|nr:peptidylprolyl isomerase [Gemmobacter straminiformis]MBC2835694.1 SurA N-terminal domain-containing protein [Gemmobacter straminiformis]
MAKHDDDDAPKKKRKVGSTLVWGLLVLIMLGLGGFGVTNFGGGVQSIGRVGEREIEVDEYARALRQQVDQMSRQFGMQLTLEQARAFGLDQQVLRSLVAKTALDNETARIGISAGDATLAAEIQKMDAFKGASGAFDRETYRFALDRNNLTEAKFEAGMRADIARSVLQGAVVGGFAAPKAYVDTLAAWQDEKRSFSVLALAEADLTSPLPAPTDAELQAVYDAQIDSFTKPEAKRITYAALRPEMLAPSITVDDAEVKAAYDAKIAEYVVPEKRLVERLVYPSEDEAKAAKAKLDAGEASFEDLVAERKLALTDIDLGDVSKEELGAAGDAVFGLTEPGVVGPVTTDFGPALFRMNAVIAAQETTFDAAKDALKAELQLVAARKQISDKFEQINDLLASGAELEEAAKEAGMEIATLDYSAETASEGIAAFEGFRKAAEAVQEGDFPEAIGLDDGTIVALRLDEVIPAAPIPLAEAKDKVTEAWRKDALAKALAARAEEIKTAVEGGASLGSFGIVSASRNLLRDASPEGLPPDVIRTAFGMKEGAVTTLSVPGFSGLIRLDAITPAPTTGDDAEALRDSIAVSARRDIAQDAFSLFSDALGAEAGIVLDQTAINAVNARLQ